MIYLDNAATTRRKPFSVLFPAFREMLFPANAGRGGHRAGIKTALRIENAREAITDFFFEGKVIFTKNCTEAINLGLLGCHLTGQVVTTVFDHNSVLRTLKRLELEGKIKMKVIAPVGGSLEGPLMEALKTPTSMVVMTARSNVTGQKIDVAGLSRITKKYSKALFFADCAQSAGHDVLDYTYVDMIASSGHKGLMGLQGSGFLLCKMQIKPYPLITGGTGSSDLGIYIPTDIPEGLEAGTANAVGIVSLGAGVRYVRKHRAMLNRRAERAANFFKEKISKEPGIIVYPCEGNIVLCNIKGKDSTETADILSREYGICVRGGYHCAPLMHRFLGTINGAVRFSFGNNNNMAHAFIAWQALRKIARL